jgi:hypothetical protein
VTDPAWEQKTPAQRIEVLDDVRRAIELVADAASNPREMAERLTELGEEDLRLVIDCPVLHRDVRNAATIELKRRRNREARS